MKGHQTRTKAVSIAEMAGIDPQLICQAAIWASSSTFVKYMLNLIAKAWLDFVLKLAASSSRVAGTGSMLGYRIPEKKSWHMHIDFPQAVVHSMPLQHCLVVFMCIQQLLSNWILLALTLFGLCYLLSWVRLFVEQLCAQYSHCIWWLVTRWACFIPLVPKGLYKHQVMERSDLW